MIHRKYVSSTCRQLSIFPDGTADEDIKAHKVSTWMLISQRRRTPLHEWESPILCLPEVRFKGRENIDNLRAAMAAVTQVLEAWDSNNPAWMPSIKYRRLEVGESLDVGDVVYAGKEVGNECRIDRVTLKLAFSQSGRSWPRIITEYRWKERGFQSYSNDTALRIIP